MRPSCITAMRSLTPMTSSMSLEIIRMATPASASAAHQLVDFALRADIDAAGRLVEDHHLAASSTATWPSTTFCWLPPERVPTPVATVGALMRERPRCRSAFVALARRVDQHRRWHRLQGRAARCSRRSNRRGSARSACGPPARDRCRASMASRGERDRDRLAVEARSCRRAAGRCRRSARASSVRPAPTRPARPRISPRRSDEVDRAAGIGRGAQALDGEHRLGAGGAAGRRVERFQVAADHQPDHARRALISPPRRARRRQRRRAARRRGRRSARPRSGDAR